MIASNTQSLMCKIVSSTLNTLSVYQDVILQHTHLNNHAHASNVWGRYIYICQHTIKLTRLCPFSVMTTSVSVWCQLYLCMDYIISKYMNLCTHNSYFTLGWSFCSRELLLERVSGIARLFVISLSKWCIYGLQVQVLQWHHTYQG